MVKFRRVRDCKTGKKGDIIEINSLPELFRMYPDRYEELPPEEGEIKKEIKKKTIEKDKYGQLSIV